MKKTLGIILAASLMLALLAGCSSSTAKNDELIMATEAGFAPYEYMEGNEVVGIDVDIANEIAKAMGKKLTIQNMDFDGALLAVQQGKVDFAAAGISVNEERQKVMDFTIEYAVSKQVIVVNKENAKVTGPDGLTADVKIGVQQGTVGDLYVTDDLGLTPTRFTKFLQAAEDLKNGKIDCIVMDGLPAEQMVKANPSLQILGEEVFTDKYAIAVKKDNKQLLDELNKVLQKLVDNGKIQEFTIKHTTK